MDLAMDTPDTRTESAWWVPADACTLSTGQQPLRVAEFDDLFAETLHSVERQPDPTQRVRLVLVGNEDLLGRVQRLVDAETACCSFFTFTIRALGPAVAGVDRTAVALDVEVPVVHAEVLAGLIGRAERARQAAAE
jgi:hypothetical protein